VQIRVCYFAVLRELVGLREEEIEVAEGSDIAELLRVLVQRYPSLGSIVGRVAIARNHQYAESHVVLREGDEIALLPPVSGGAPTPPSPTSDDAQSLVAAEGRLRLSFDPLDVSEVSRLVERKEAGAIVTFAGAVRRQSQGRLVTHLDYEAYPPMVLTQMQRVVDEALAQWPEAKIAIHHRIGTLTIGDLAVAIAVSTPHRKEAFAACSFTIDRLKEVVPIWKREYFEDGEHWVGWGP
jgi:molybdopterin synthase catalytic subunit